MQSIRSINTKDFALGQVQTNLITVLRDIARKEIIDGQLVENVAIGTTNTAISHKLGRTPLGYVIVGKNGPGDIYMSGESDSLTLNLTSTAAVTASLWVF